MHGRRSTVTVTGSDEAGTLQGAISGNGGLWTTEQRLEPSTTYVLEATVRGEDGDLVTRTSWSQTEERTLDQRSTRR